MIITVSQLLPSLISLPTCKTTSYQNSLPQQNTIITPEQKSIHYLISKPLPSSKWYTLIAYSPSQSTYTYILSESYLRQNHFPSQSPYSVWNLFSSSILLLPTSRFPVSIVSLETDRSLSEAQDFIFQLPCSSKISTSHLRTLIRDCISKWGLREFETL